MSEYTELDMSQYEDALEEIEQEPIDASKIIDFKKIKGLKFGDASIEKKFSYMKWYDFYDNMDPEEAYFESDFFLSFLLYRYMKIYNIPPRYTVFCDDVVTRKFFNNIIEKIDMPKDAYNFSLSHDNRGSKLNSLTIHFQKMVVHYDGNSAYVIYPQNYIEDKESMLYTFLGLLKSYRIPPVQRNKIYVVYRSVNGFKKKSFEVKKRKDIDLVHNYNDGFIDVAKDIIHKLNNKKKPGLVILSGQPGVGKTTFLRYLAGKLKRNIIFISPDMVHHITSPEFIPFLMDNSDSILIIEDAEPALQKRHGDERSGAVSNILNMTDGLLSDCLNISIVATFNTQITDIDEALLRKGRLLKSYKFDKLNKEKSQELLNRIGKEYIKANGPMSLAEIYFADDEIGLSTDFERRKTGFNK